MIWPWKDVNRIAVVEHPEHYQLYIHLWCWWFKTNGEMIKCFISPITGKQRSVIFWRLEGSENGSVCTAWWVITVFIFFSVILLKDNF